MKTKIMFITLTVFFITSCGNKKEEKEIKMPIKKEIVQTESIMTSAPIKIVEEDNPLSKYISDKVYNEGLKIFYGDKRSMFAANTDIFSANQEKLKIYIETKFKPTMLVTQNGINSAVVYYLENGSKSRVMVRGLKIIEIEEIVYYIKVFKDRIEIKQGENGIAVPLYLRER